jgi:2-aminoethylphosphonate-pyruvate transaminase
LLVSYPEHKVSNPKAFPRDNVPTRAVLLDVTPESPERPASSGTRLVGGQPLIGRLLRALAAASFDEVIVVGPADPRTGREADTDLGLDVTWVEAPFGTPDGMLLLCARPHLRGPALCLTTSHLVSNQFLAATHDVPGAGNHVVLAVDNNLSRAPDLGSPALLAMDGTRVTAIGADLADPQALSTSAFITAPAIFAELARLDAPTIAEALGRLAATGGLHGHDIGGALWQVVTDGAAVVHAEWMLRLFGDDLDAGQPEPAPARNDPRYTLEHIRAVLAQKDARHYVLLNPGPVNTTAKVKSALVHHDVCHRDADYADVVLRIERKLKRVFRAGGEHSVVMITGSGTASMEAAISSTIPPGKRLLVIDNGAFGARLAEIAEVHDIPVVRLAYAWGQLPVVAEVERALVADPSIAAVAMIHHETSVGLLNPVGEVGALCRKHDRLLLVDTVSSLGGEELDVGRDAIDVCFSSANKCIHAVSGISFVCVNERAWQRIEQVRPRVYYLDLKRYRRYLRSSGETPFTPAVSTFFALDTALDELLAEGVPRRHQRYRRWNRRIRSRLRELGCQPLTDTGRESCTLTCASLPPGVSYSDLYAWLKERGYLIYNCKDELKDHYFQIANMGDLSDETIERFLDAFAEAVQRLRLPAAAPDSRRAHLRL